MIVETPYLFPHLSAPLLGEEARKPPTDLGKEPFEIGKGKGRGMDMAHSMIYNLRCIISYVLFHLIAEWSGETYAPRALVSKGHQQKVRRSPCTATKAFIKAHPPTTQSTIDTAA